MKQSTLKTPQLIIGLILFIALGIGLKLLFDKVLPPQEQVQAWMMAQGIWGWLVYFLFGITAVWFVPLNFSLTGIAGGFVYGLWPAFLTNWACKIIGTSIAFLLGRHFGHKIFPLFGKKNLKKYTALACSEESIIAFFVLSFLPFGPSDVVAYFLGISKLTKTQFLLLTTAGSSGTAFLLAYVGSGDIFQKPLILALFVLFLSGGAFFIHRNKRTLHLE